ncbi:hypothetical protein [Paenibacillus dokdonensis]
MRLTLLLPSIAKRKSAPNVQRSAFYVHLYGFAYAGKARAYSLLQRDALQ